MFVKNFYKSVGMASTKGNTTTTYTNYTGETKTQSYQNNYAYTYVGYAYHMKTVSTSSSSVGTVFGTGDVTPTIEDYKLSGDLIETLSGTASSTETFDDNGFVVEALYTLTNTGTEDITIKEVGIIGAIYSTMLYERTVLDEPVTIPAGGVGQVTYTIRMNYPTT